jgi:Protein of unknown function (DUF3224)
MVRAIGPFEVQLTPAPEELDIDILLGRQLIAKQFHGDLEGTSQGQMLTAGTSIANSAGYVALERVSGLLHGRAGGFTLQHSATMNRGAPELSITVVPDSGTDQLTGLEGAMKIVIDEGAHSYEFEYTLPESG